MTSSSPADESPSTRVRHFFRWLSSGWWPWVSVPALVTLVIMFSADHHPLSSVAILLVPSSAWIGFRRHEARVRTWKTT